MNKRIGPYHILQTLHVGTFGTTYLGARQFQDQVLRHVVIKKVSPLNTSLPTEAALLIHLNHPHIVKILDVLKSGQDTWLITDYLVGWNLDQFLSRIKTTPLSEPQQIYVILKILSELLEAISFLHQNHLVHGDIHPSNIRITPHLSVCVIDFDAAQKIVSGKKQAALGLRPGWSSPEKTQTQQEDPSGDFYSFSTLVKTIAEILPTLNQHPSFFALLTCAHQVKIIDSDQRADLWLAYRDLLQQARVHAEAQIHVHELQREVQTWDPHTPLPTQKLTPDPTLSPVTVWRKKWQVPWLRTAPLMMILGLLLGWDSPSILQSSSPTPSLIIQAKPWAEVKLNQKPVGTTPLRLTLSSNTQPVTIHAQYRNHTQVKTLRWADLNKAAPIVVQFDMDKKP